MKQLFFKDININDPFFDSLKDSYREFPNWFAKKAQEKAFVTFEENTNDINGFLYLKREDGAMSDVCPSQDNKKRIKVGTFKIRGRGTKYGERFIKKIMDTALTQDVDEVYVTIFDKHDSLISLIKKYGFERRATKKTVNGIEDVYFKNLRVSKNDILLNYPLIQVNNKRKFCLSISPEYHTKLFPDSILATENYNIIEDVSHTNSIPKIYVCNMYSAQGLKPGDIILIYRIGDKKSPAHYRSVITSVCVLEEVRHKGTFSSYNEFIQYVNTYSVLDEDELSKKWNRNNLITLKMTYNAALTKRVTKQMLMEEFGVSPKYWGIFPLTDNQFEQIIRRGEIYENIIID